MKRIAPPTVAGFADEASAVAVAPGLTWIAVASVAVPKPLLARTVNAESPAAVGVPVTVPSGRSASPGGSEPESTETVADPVPPVLKANEYGAPTVPAGGVPVMLAATPRSRPASTGS